MASVTVRLVTMFSRIGRESIDLASSNGHHSVLRILGITTGLRGQVGSSTSASNHPIVPDLVFNGSRFKSMLSAFYDLRILSGLLRCLGQAVVNWPYAFKWGLRVLIRGGDGRLGQLTPPV